MAILKCKMCGGELEIIDESSVCECEYCGSKQTIPTIDNEKIMKLYDRANRLRMSNEFDKAAGVYESIVEEADTEAEAYWGLILCKYGIEYVDDPATGNKIPTCHRVSFDSIMEDDDFELVMENADSLSKSVYRESAKQIEEIRKGIIEVSGKEEPYDIFICYKETAEDGDRTVDSVIAQDVYDALTSKGYRVFFSRITLEDKLGTEYEPYIFAALNSAKVMLAFGTSYDYYNAVWVKNEWSRYLKLMAKDKEKYLIPCYKDIDAYDMPKEFKHLQAQDMGKVGAVQDLLRGIDKLLAKTQQSSRNVIQNNSGLGMLTMRGNLALEDEDYDKAYEFFERALDENPVDSKAYLGKVLASLKFKNADELKNSDMLIDLDNISDFKHAREFSSGSDKAILDEIYEIVEKKVKARYLIQVLKKCSIKKEKDEIDKKRAKKIEYDAKIAKINEDIVLEIEKSRNVILEEAKIKKQPIMSEMNKEIQNVKSKKMSLYAQKIKLEDQRASLGLFKGKQKAEINQQISAIDAQIDSLETEQSISQKYQKIFDAIELEASESVRDVADKVRSKYTIPKLEE